MMMMEKRMKRLKNRLYMFMIVVVKMKFKQEPIASA